jgi:tRNA(Ile)-lysidine synthetase-like protein
VALLRLLAASRRLLRTGPVAVAHLDHGLRPGSEADATFVAVLADELGLPAVVERRPVRRRRGESPEEAARRVRYRFLADAAGALGCDVVVTAHHLDDQAETVLYRVLRGSGLAGLRGILPATEIEGVRVVRPLLAFRREELRRWLGTLGQAWCDDPGNVGGNDRARLRNEILPAVRRLLRRDPAPPLARLAEVARDEFGRAPPAPRREVEARPVRPEAPGSVEWEIVPVGNAVFLERLRAAPGTCELLDADRVRGAVTVRAPRPGDRFQPLGLARAQRLGHYLQRRGVTEDRRAGVRLLCDDEGILWVAGHGIAARAAVGNDTRRVLVARRVSER